MNGEKEARPAPAAFFRALLDDMHAGRRHPLDHYQRLFPGREAAIAEAWRECHDDQEEHLLPNSPDSVQTIGDYEIVQELGRGGQAVVYLARDRRLQREVALKVFPRSSASPEMVVRLRREAAALSRIDDRGICSVYEFGEAQRESWIAMRYVKGRTLADEIRALRGPAHAEGFRSRGKRMLRLIEEVARSIHKAHAIGIVHRDLKPGNVMIDVDDHPVVLDFGLARDEESGTPTLTRTGDLLGTPAYMSPEQISGRVHEADARCDVYALGVCLYECLTLRRPFAAPTHDELARKIASDEPTDPRRIDRRIPRDVSTVIALAMAKDPRRRYASAIDLAEDLRRAREGEPILAHRPGAHERVVRWVRRHPLQAALAVAVLVAIALGTYLAVRWSDLRAGDERRRAAAVEDALEVAFDSLASNARVEACLSRLDAAEKAAGSTVDVAVGRILSLVRIGQAEKALATLDEMPDRGESEPALRWARWTILEKLGNPAASRYREQLGEPPDGLCTLIAAIDARDRLSGAEATVFRPEIRKMLRTVLRAPVPRRSFHLLLLELAAEGGDTETAILVADAMLALWPDATTSWIGMGHACQKSEPFRAVRSFRKAIALGANPLEHRLTLLLANAYSAAGDEAACVQAYRDALAVPDGLGVGDRVLALYNLGDSLYLLGDWEASLEASRLAIVANGPRPNRVHAMALCNTAQALVYLGRFDDAIDALRRGHEMGAATEGWKFPSAEWLATMEEYAGLARRLDSVAGLDRPPEEDGVLWKWAAAAALAGRHATAARWFRSVHGPDATVPPRSGLHPWASRFVAASAAVHAAAADGRDAAGLDEAERAGFGALGITWLEAELESARRSLDAKQTTAATALPRLQRWRVGPALEPLRDGRAVRHLSAGERDRLKALWAAWEQLVARTHPES